MVSEHVAPLASTVRSAVVMVSLAVPRSIAIAVGPLKLRKSVIQPRSMAGVPVSYVMEAECAVVEHRHAEREPAVTGVIDVERRRNAGIAVRGIAVRGCVGSIAVVNRDIGCRAIGCAAALRAGIDGRFSIDVGGAGGVGADRRVDRRGIDDVAPSGRARMRHRAPCRHRALLRPRRSSCTPLQQRTRRGAPKDVLRSESPCFTRSRDSPSYHGRQTGSPEK